jgi:pimeloyl-ACP methyl ester carboxylesterase/DNA-binding CsgD family transcriptional regulator
MSSRAAAFLERFRRADADDALLHVMVDDYDGLAAAMAETPAELLAAADAAVIAAGPPVDLHADSFASAACDSNGGVIVAEPRFGEWLGGADPLAAVVRACSDVRPSVSTIADDRSGRPVAVAAARLALARRWPLAPAVRAALDSGAGVFAVVAFRPDASAWDQAARAYGLSPQENRLAAALARRGDLQLAAQATGVAYETARKLVGNAMRKVGAARQTDLVRLILSAAAGGAGAPEGGARPFADLFGLSMRQAELARAIAHGATRDMAADAIGISRHGAKTDLRVVFQACGVANAVDLARIVAEVDALIGLSTACSVEIAPFGGDAEPLRLVARRWAPGRIAVTDHGPASARPLLMFHPAVGGRHQPRCLVAALQAAGWRPIGFDRPGFGLSDMAGSDPFAAAAADVGDILAALEIDRVTILARGGSTAALATAAALGNRIAGGILIGPEPPADLDSRRAGMMGRGKALFFGTPALAAAFARILSRRTSSAQIARMQRQSVAGSAIDEAAIEDADNLADIVRASRQAALGMRGFLAELQAHGAGARPAPLADAHGWVVIAGARDPLYDFAATRDFWQQTLPGASIQAIPDGGRWLHLTHVAAIVAALEPVAAAH